MSDVSPLSTPSRTRWLLAALAVAAISLLGFASPENRATSGMTLDPNGVVTRVVDGGPAARAGVRPDDRVIAIDGVPYAAATRPFRAARPSIGDRWRYELARGDASLTVSIDFEHVPDSTLVSFVAAGAVGLIFLVCGLSVYFRRPSSLTRLAAVLGLSGMVGFSVPPYVPDPGLRIALSLTLATLGTLSLPLLLEISLRFPDRSAPRPGIRLAIYAPIFLIVVAFAMTIFVAPSKVAILAGIGGAVSAAYGLAILATALVRWRRSASSEHRQAATLWVAAIAFTLVLSLIGVLVPGMPGGPFYFFSIVVLPIVIAYALERPIAGAS